MKENSEDRDCPTNENDHDFFRKELTRRMEQLLARRPAGDPVHAINPEDNKDGADQVARLMEQNAAISLCNQTTHQLQDIRAAIARLSAGMYGRCMSCGEQIVKARLIANPSAALCLHCQSREDLDQWLSFSSHGDSGRPLRSA